jgi:hypothetical protein
MCVFRHSQQILDILIIYIFNATCFDHTRSSESSAGNNPEAEFSFKKGHYTLQLK